MCGIVGFTGVQSAAPLLLDGLKKLEYRGYDSAGIAVMDGQKITVSKVTGRIANLCEKTQDGADVPGSTGIGHTRWATHGAPTEENAHPHLSNDGRFAVVHNGIIENYMQLRDELIRDGYHFESETDTEVIVHLIEMYYRGNMRKALLKTTNRLQGSYALGVICSEEPGKIYAVREASPLILGVGVFFRRRPVGSPAGVADPCRPGHACPVPGFLAQICDAPRHLAHCNLLPVHDGNACRIIAPVFQLFQSVQQERRGALRTGKSNNSTHKDCLPELVFLFFSLC